MYDQFKSSTSRIAGIYEQYERAKRFVQISKRCNKTTSRFRNLMAAVYPGRAIVELMLEAAEKQELKAFLNIDVSESRNNLEKELAPKLPYYYMLEKIRIHDFHRFCCLPPSSKYQTTFVGGPIKLRARKGIAAIRILPNGPKYIKTGQSLVKEQRILYANDGHFYDEKSGKYIPLEEIINDFLKAIPKVINDFECYYQTK